MIAFEFARDAHRRCRRFLGLLPPSIPFSNRNNGRFGDKIDRAQPAWTWLVSCFYMVLFLATFCLALRRGTGGTSCAGVPRGHVARHSWPRYCDFRGKSAVIRHYRPPAQPVAIMPFFSQTLNLFTRVKWGLIPLADGSADCCRVLCAGRAGCRKGNGFGIGGACPSCSGRWPSFRCTDTGRADGASVFSPTSLFLLCFCWC